jgi:effector-binding domain-containing protein
MAFFVDNSTLSQQHGRVVVRDLPVETMAAAVYRGSYDDFTAVGQLHVDIGKWIEANGCHLAGPSREIYLKTPDPPGGEGLMELQYPVAKG